MLKKLSNLNRLMVLTLISYSLLLSSPHLLFSQEGDLIGHSWKNFQVAREFLMALRGGDFESAHKLADKDFQKVTTPETLRKIYLALLKKWGKMIFTNKYRREDSKQYLFYFFSCNFGNRSQTLKVSVNKKEGKVSGFFILPGEDDNSPPPPYISQKKFNESPFEIRNGPFRLGGTLTLPEGEKKWPLIILVHGSGPNNRNETLGPNLPFQDLAWGLANRGLAVLRYDKRTYIYGDKSAPSGSITLKEETLDDVAAAFYQIRAHPLINSDRVYLLGHSLGGYALPLISARIPEARGFISMAGNSNPIEDLFLDQILYLNSEFKGNEKNPYLGMISEVKKQKETIKKLKTGFIPQEKTLLYVPLSYWKFLKDYRPWEWVLKSLKPWLFLQGERDYQVTLKDFLIWKKELKNRPQTTFKSFPGLNHLFIMGEGKSLPSEYQKKGYVAEEVIQTIEEFIRGS